MGENLPEKVETRIVKDFHPWHGAFDSKGCGICNILRTAIREAIEEAELRGHRSGETCDLQHSGAAE